MSQSRLKTGSLVDALLSLSLNQTNDCNNNYKNYAIHEELAKAGKLKQAKLPLYQIPDDIIKIENSKATKKCVSSVENRKNEMSDYRFNERKYIDAYKTMIYFEEASEGNFLRQFDQTNLQLRYSGDKNGRYYISVDDKTSELNEAIDEGIIDQFTLKPVKSSMDRDIYGSIGSKNDNKIFLDISEDDCDYVAQNSQKQSYKMNFCVNKQPFQLQHNALKLLHDLNLFNCLIDNPKYNDDSEESEICNRQEFSGQLGKKLNKEQKNAVMNIVNTKNFPLPYLLYGPAGTGKTSTLVAAIEEIVRSSSKNVLVCANSNAACDEVTERLVNVLRHGEMFRLYAKSYNGGKISERVRPICNWLNDEYHFPSLQFLYQFRVLVCTLGTAGVLTRARDDPHFKSDHFSHIIIDECASTHETMTLIPITGLCSSYNRIRSSIVLAGDPKQLDAVTKSNNAAKLGFRKSFMEHLFDRRLYKRNPVSGEYNKKYITQLVKNYRSHSAILRIPNNLFYENKLEVMAPKDITDWYIGSDVLPSQQFPVIFQSVQGECKKLKQSFSKYNLDEVNVVIDFIKKLLENCNANGKHLLQSDIGVVSPYKLQCKEISRACRKNNYKEITIGTAEIFQGQEKPVMIVSTVRTNGKFGFVSNSRRFNVVVTRAKCLLIIVGDPHTLCLNEDWNELIKYCLQNNALVQGKKHFDMPEKYED